MEKVNATLLCYPRQRSCDNIATFMSSKLKLNKANCVTELFLGGLMRSKAQAYRIMHLL